MEFNLAQLNDAVAQANPERDAIVHGERRYSYADFAERTNRLASYFVAQGLGVRRERAELAGHESGQAHVALYLHNCPEYLEGMVGAYKARVAPFNVNYRYVEEELRYLLADSAADAVVYHSAFAATLANIRGELPLLQVLIQVPDDSGADLLDGAVWYDDALAGVAAAAPENPAHPDDLYILYTGGTTGMPKGVLWRQADVFPAALGGRQLGTTNEWPDLDTVVETSRTGGVRFMPAPPFMHGAAHWMAFNAFTGGHSLVLPTDTTTFDPVDVWSTIEREKVNILLIVGDAFARPLLDELERNTYDLSSMLMIVSGGAALSAPVKNALLAKLPAIAIMDGLGSSETGQQASQVTGSGTDASTGTFTPGPGMCIVSDDLTRVIPSSSTELGWLAQEGRVPLGYLGDADKTARTFPVIGDTRYSVPGDRANYTPEGLLELHGRDSVTINSGGEKIFAEEVEQALANHPAVYDAIVAGRPSERWGNEVVAIVQLRQGTTATEDELLSTCEQHIARYKLPKSFVFVDKVERSPSGKADYRWAKEQALKPQ